MKKLIFIFVFIIILSSISFSLDNDFLKELQIFYNIKSSGEVEVINYLTFYPTEDSSKFIFTIPRELFEIKNIHLSETLGRKETSFPFNFETNENEYKIVWLYKGLKTLKIFCLKYTLYKAIKVYDDVVDFQFKVWKKECGNEVSSLLVELNLPSQIKSRGAVECWIYPKKNNEISWKDDYKGIVAYIKNIPTEEWVELRVIFPTSYIENIDPSKVVLISGLGREKISYEERLREKNEEIKERKIRIIRCIIISFCFIFLFLGIFLPLRVYLKYGKQPDVDHSFKYEKEIPADIPPGWVEMLIKQGNNISINSIIASILELGRLGYMKILEEERIINDKKFKDYKIIFNDKDNDKDQENLSEDLDLLYKEFRRFGDEFYISSLKARNLEKIKKSFNNRIKKAIYVKKWLSKRGENQINNISSFFFTCLNLFFIVGFILVPYIGLTPELILLFLICLLAFILPFFLKKYVRRYSKNGKLLMLKWKAFRNYLKNLPDISSGNLYLSKDLQERYIIYGVVLGVIDNVLKAMEMNSTDFTQIDWFISKSPNMFSKSLRSFINLFYIRSSLLPLFKIIKWIHF